jgi:hypothetical protein
MQVARALGRTRPHIKQRLLLYGAHSKISHTHCLVALSPQAIREVELVLEGMSRQIWNLNPTFSKSELHVLMEDLARPQYPLRMGGLLRGGYRLLDSDPQR